MPSEKRTVPRGRAGLPVRLVRLEVIEGPDRGRAHTDESGSFTVGTAAGNDLVLTDPTVSRFHLEIRRRADRILVIDLDSTNGTAIGPALIKGGQAAVRPGTVLDVGGTRLRVGDGEVIMVDRGPETLGELRGRSAVMRQLMARLKRVSESDVAVLLQGESGTGKELAARALHDHGPRAGQPFVTVDCAALSPTLFASELFGHERGAFTGADRRHMGAFERASGGTVFLDEVGELPADLQATLLGVLERRRLVRVGGSEEIAVDVRLISATHRDLRAEVNAGGFRLDLFYRLAAVLLTMPPLREHAEDIPMLVEHFLRESGSAAAMEDIFPAPRVKELTVHGWPGNVRELRNVVLGLVALGGEVLDLRPPPPATAGADLAAQVLDRSYREARQAVLDDFERRYLEHLLRRSNGSVRQAARDARMDRSYLTELIRRYGLR